MTYGPGDEVICVDNTPTDDEMSAFMCKFITVGQTYTVEAIIREGPSRGVHIVGIPISDGWGHRIGYWAKRFAKAEKKSEGMSTAFWNKINSPVEGLDVDLPEVPKAPAKKKERA